MSAPNNPESTITDQAVLEYLKKKGLDSAVLELTQKLEHESAQEKLETQDAIYKAQRSVLAKSTGGNYGYDRDSAWPVIHWGVPDSNIEGNETGVAEARGYVDSFVSLQLWVLSLPDERHSGIVAIDNPIRRAQELLHSETAQVSLKSVVQELAPKPTSGLATSSEDKDALHFNLPPSAKPELLAVTFALLVHTYCELLEVGMETTAHTIRDAFKPIYDILYEQEYRDLYQCKSTEDMMKLNSYNSQHLEALATLKSILVKVASYGLHAQELKARTTFNGKALDANQNLQKEQKLLEYDRHIKNYQQKHAEISEKAVAAFDKMHDLPFLRRVRAVRWQLTLSTISYGLLTTYLRNNAQNVSTLLQTKCEVHVERREPYPFTPACVLDSINSKSGLLELNSTPIYWAAPMPRSETDQELPFPKYNLRDIYDSETEARRDKRAVEFNRALLVRGFRRLEALERKRENDVVALPTKRKRQLANALEPSILMTTLSSSTAGPFVVNKAKTNMDVSSIWQESGIGLTCAKLCEPDGRRVAAGCDDAAVRIWSAQESSTNEPLQVLLGHKNGFPVFDVDWNRDGRALLSAGGDGSVRLWDTMATGPFGEVASLNETPPDIPIDGPEAMVPGLRSEESKYKSGTALAVYRGHAPSAPVWSVAFAPSGYYFASAGADATARLWTTDRTVPVRLLSGHSSANVNCVSWHPNCNYVITGSDDKTARLWDIQTGRTVRLMTGCHGGVHQAQISPGGQYAAIADHTGIVYLWDLGTGKKITEFRPNLSENRAGLPATNSMIHALRFSACGSALAAGGDDCCVRIWDVRKESTDGKPVIREPTKLFPTKQTMILDLYFTKRNLLLAAGKFVTPVPLAPHAQI